MFRFPMRGQFLHAFPKHHEGMVMKQCRPRFKKDQFMRFSSQEANASASSTKNTWVEVDGPAGSNLKYWWNSATNQTTHLGAPKPPDSSFFHSRFSHCGYGGYGGYGNGGGNIHGPGCQPHYPYGYGYSYGRRHCFGGFLKFGAAVLLTAFAARCVFYKDHAWRHHNCHHCHHYPEGQCPRCKKTIENKPNNDSSTVPSSPPSTSA